jgi:hypothetical protein
MEHRRFYPGDCRRELEEFLAGHEPPASCPPALVAASVPHAGWRYSGGVAARTLATLAARSRPASLILLGAYHRPLSGVSAIYPSGAWETPLGPLAIDSDLAAQACARLTGLLAADLEAHAAEHSLEVIAPMVHALFPNVPVVPILVLPQADPVRLGEELARLAEPRGAVVVASTDLTHYGERYGFVPAGAGPEAHEWMRTNDEHLLDLASALDAERIPEEARRRRNACGPGALAAACAFARSRGVRAGEVLEHTDSFDVQGASGEFHTAVGYAGMVF